MSTRPTTNKYNYKAHTEHLESRADVAANHQVSDQLQVSTSLESSSR